MLYTNFRAVSVMTARLQVEVGVKSAITDKQPV